jgi:uncharacterized protein YjiS (DUF1127 family)
MAYVNTTRVAHLSLADRISAVVAAVKVALQRRRVYLNTLRELDALSDRDLADMSLHRSMLVGIAREAAYGK